MKKLLTWVLIMMLAVFMPLGTLAEGLEVEYDESANTAVMASEESLTDNEPEIIASESECPVENDDVVSECYSEYQPLCSSDPAKEKGHAFWEYRLVYPDRHIMP